MICSSQAAAYPYNMLDGQPKMDITSVVSSFEDNTFNLNFHNSIESIPSSENDNENVDEDDSDTDCIDKTVSEGVRRPQTNFIALR
jgi:hypothetical protein